MHSHREPAFNLPGLMVGCLAVLAGIHAIRWLLPYRWDVHLVFLFGFTPARYTEPFLLGGGAVPGGFGAQLWTFVTYGFLHGGWLHLMVNLAWLVAFGTPVLRRLGNRRFLLLALAATVAGALAHLATNWGSVVPMIGASAGISGLMAGAIRFVFQSGGLQDSLGPYGGGNRRQPVAPLIEALRNRTVLVFVGFWFAINIVFGVAAIGVSGGDSIAWQAHFGGFFAGLFLFPLIDRTVPPPEPAPEWPHDERP
ncbi:rhomboid family intramembrane serine protease [Lutibaculum baratangense]|uniref:rhomboid family intramembrane serine protease n=1 Tax=Lutibaculum baratangense TaxID=1358440 RepID=UPI001FCAF4F1|nr:rhomboid family intramembrane serine protease [Lutibaculum baratangense]